jgi:hypothetical protein
LVGKSEEKRTLGRPRRRWEYNIKMEFMKWDGRSWTGLIWLRIGTGGGFLWMRWWTSGFRKKWGISWLAEELLASQDGLWYVEWTAEDTLQVFVTEELIQYARCLNCGIDHYFVCHSRGGRYSCTHS